MPIHSEFYWVLLQKQINEHRRITQVDVALASETGPATINRLATDQAKGISREVLIRLRTYFGLPGETRLKLRELLDVRGLGDKSEKEISELLGVHPATVKLMVNDILDSYDFPVLGRICARLELNSLEELLDTGGLLSWATEDTPVSEGGNEGQAG